MTQYQVRVIGLDDEPFITNRKEFALSYSGSMRSLGYMTKFAIITVEVPRQTTHSFTLGSTKEIYRGLYKLDVEATPSKRDRVKRWAPSVKFQSWAAILPNFSLYQQPKYKSSLLAA
jgi:hypothetical protein